MIKYYFKTAWRSIIKNKTSTPINVLGLSIGISAALIIFMMIQYDFSFDKYEPGGQRIYRIVTESERWKDPGVPLPLIQVANQNISGIENVAPLVQYNDLNTRVSVPQGNNKPIQLFKKQDAIVFTDSNYFSLFPHEWLAGSAGTSLLNPYQLVLSESKAKEYFPGIPPGQVIGQTVFFSDTLRTVVKGIVKDLKANSDFEYKAFLSVSTISAANLQNWYSWNDWGSINSYSQVWVKLSAGTTPAKIDKQLKEVFKKYDTEGDVSKDIHRLQPLSDVHTNPDFEGPVNKNTVVNLLLLALFLLLLGAINFINLSTAYATKRAKEIGIRKTLGSNKRQLVLQFLSETFLLTLFATILSIAITPILLKAFAGFMPDGLHFEDLMMQPAVWFFLLLLILVVSLMAGLYPAFILTKFKPVLVLKNKIINNSGATHGAFLRKSLIVSQFVIAQVFIIGMLIVDKQIHFSLQQDMGFRTNAIINFPVPIDFEHPSNKKFLLRDEFAAIPGIQQVSLGNQSPAMKGQMSTDITFTQNKKEETLHVDQRFGDTSFLNVYNIKLLAGRNIRPADSATELLINETLAKQLGFAQPADAINHFVNFSGRPMPIVGVMKDFHQASLRTSIHPLIYWFSPKFGFIIHVALQPNPETWKTTLAKLENSWKNIYPDEDFEYTFLDKKIADFYKEDSQLSTLLTWSAAVAIFINCLGLLGLIIFLTNNRMKEIGVRKVLGATAKQIIALLSIDFLKLLALAFVIAIPIAWWQTNSWLQNFAYHTALSWWIFLISGIIMIMVALVIVCLCAGNAAIANPVDSLKSE